VATGPFGLDDVEQFARAGHRSSASGSGAKILRALSITGQGLRQYRQFDREDRDDRRTTGFRADETASTCSSVVNAVTFNRSPSAVRSWINPIELSAEVFVTGIFT